MNELFSGVFESASAQLQLGDFLLCISTSLLIGAILAVFYMIKNKYTRSFIFTLFLLPAVVCVVIMMVNGNIGAGIAVAGAFGLVRFRSAQGSAKEICAIFIAMSVGLMTGMGYIAYATVFAIVLGLAMMIFNIFGSKAEHKENVLLITIPENLEYDTVFNDIFNEYLENKKLVAVKTSNMGSLYKLTYNILFKHGVNKKEFIDKLRCRNANLEISIMQKDFYNQDSQGGTL